MKARLTLLVVLALGCKASFAQNAPLQFRGFIAYKSLMMYSLPGRGIVIEAYRADGTWGPLYESHQGAAADSPIAYATPRPYSGIYSYQRVNGFSGKMTRNAGEFVAELDMYFSSAAHASGTDAYYAVDYFSTASREEMVNTSTRTNIAGGKSSIVGFVVAGTRSRWVLVRAVGPGLKSFGVPTYLSDPKLEIFGAAGVHYTATGWKALASDPDHQACLVAIMDFLGAFPLATDSDDAVYFVQLPPGVYSVVCSSTSGTKEGEVLTEVYLLP